MMQQNVKYDSLTGKVYEELGCPSKSSNNKVSISSTFYVRIFHAEVFFCSYILAKKTLLYEKRAHKMLMKLTKGVAKVEYRWRYQEKCQQRNVNNFNNKQQRVRTAKSSRYQVCNNLFLWLKLQTVTCQNENHIFQIVYWVCQELSSHIWPLLKQLVFLRQQMNMARALNQTTVTKLGLSKSLMP